MSLSSQTILHVAIFKPLRHCFDYLLPDNENTSSLKPGIRLLVPFGKTQVVAVLLAVNQTSCIPPEKLKPITAILDEEPIFTPAIFELYQWASRYYQHPIGEVILGTLPVLFRTLSKKNPTKKIIPKALLVTPRQTQSPLALNSDQQTAVEKINSAPGFETFLLEGVTGSGKTEVYLQVIAQVLEKNKQALVLVPEIGLTPQTIARFEQRFSVPIIALHSKLTNAQRRDAWIRASRGEAKIIIGTRSAIFTPFTNLGVIILDEEHDQSFKQQSGFRYSARDLAIVRGRLENIPVILGTATPCLETFYNSDTGRYTRLLLPLRAGSALMPSFHLLDLRSKQLEHGLDPQLITVMREHLQQGNQVLLFLNRRGYAPVLMCHACGWSAQCLRCDARLTLHHRPQRLVCHHCDKEYAMLKICGACHSPELFHLGVGTERLEHGLKAHFPYTEIIRIDRDTIRHKDAMEHALTQIIDGKNQILIGTQMLAKGHHFPNVTLVGVVETDSGLYSTDFRATERMGQLILQVAGRAGRAEKPGQVFLQTHQPDNILLQTLIHQGYAAFAKVLLEERKKAYWPPFSYLALLRAETKKEKSALDFLLKVKDISKDISKDIKLLGPIPALMERKAGFFRAVLLFQACDRQVLQRYLSALMLRIEALKIKGRVRWSLDVDPGEMG